MNEFPEVAKEGLGPLRGIKAEVDLKTGVDARFCRSRPVPFALRDQVGEAIQKQVEDGELEPVDQSEWPRAAPIVVVKKKDGGIRICADFKTTVNHTCR